MKYINNILIVTKKYTLPSNYDPGVNTTALAAFNEMQNDAYAAGIELNIVSGYRSYNLQQQIFAENAAEKGEQEANRSSAKAGQSEHQTGLAFDINSTNQSFGNTKEGKWLAENCHKYGFIIRYPEGKESVTGYIYEPWHIRYVGNPTATEIYERGTTLEEYLGFSNQ